MTNRPLPRTSLACLLTVWVSACATGPNAALDPASGYVGPQLAVFDLVCKPKLSGQEDLIFHVVRADDGSAVVNEMNGKPLLEFFTQTYMNAYTWTDGKVNYTADRFTGVLTIDPSGAKYDCARRGIQRF